MNIDISNIITLDDKNKYIVLSKINFENKTYYYLIDINNNTNIMICYEDKNELVMLNNSETVKKIMPLFLKSLRNELNKLK